MTAQPVSAAGSGEGLSLSDLDKLILPSKVFLGPGQGDATPAQPVSAARSEPVAWRYRNAGWPKWRYCDLKPRGAYDIVKPLYDTPTPALAPQGDTLDEVRRIAGELREMLDASLERLSPQADPLWHVKAASRSVIEDMAAERDKAVEACDDFRRCAEADEIARDSALMRLERLRSYAASVWFDEATATDEERELMEQSR